MEDKNKDRVMELFSRHPQLKEGLDWPDSHLSAQDSEAKTRFDAAKLFWNGGLEAEALKTLQNTKWWNAYRGKVYQAIRSSAQNGPVRLFLIEGGPLSRLEAKGMCQIVEDVKKDLTKPSVISETRLGSVKELEALLIAHGL